MTQCPSCGVINKPGTRFCNNCGAPLGMQTIALGGMVQGRYTVIRLLGQGGMGAVYQVADEDTRRAYELILNVPVRPAFLEFRQENTK